MKVLLASWDQTGNHELKTTPKKPKKPKTAQGWKNQNIAEMISQKGIKNESLAPPKSMEPCRYT